MNNFNKSKDNNLKFRLAILFYSFGIILCLLLSAHFPGMGTLGLVLLAIIGFLRAARNLLLPGDSRNKITLVHIVAILLIIFIVGISIS